MSWICIFNAKYIIIYNQFYIFFKYITKRVEDIYSILNISEYTTNFIHFYKSIVDCILFEVFGN